MKLRFICLSNVKDTHGCHLKFGEACITQTIFGVFRSETVVVCAIFGPVVTLGKVPGKDADKDGKTINATVRLPSCLQL